MSKNIEEMENKSGGKFKNALEMTNSESFLAVLICNESLRKEKKPEELKQMAAKYAEECSAAERAAMEKTSQKVSDALRQRGFPVAFERSMRLNKEETKEFMEYVHNAEWLQYIDQTAEEIEQMLMSGCSKTDTDTLIQCSIEDCERINAEYMRFRQTYFPFLSDGDDIFKS